MGGNRGKWGGGWKKMGGNDFPGTAGTEVGCSSLPTVGVGRGILRGGGGTVRGVSGSTRKPPVGRGALGFWLPFPGATGPYGPTDCPLGKPGVSAPHSPDGLANNGWGTRLLVRSVCAWDGGKQVTAGGITVPNAY